MSTADIQKQPRKIGEGHAQAMLRQGLKELQAAVYSESNVAREPEPGTFGSPTQGEIAAERRADPGASILDRHSEDARQHVQANAREERDRGVHDSPSMDHDEPERE